MKYTSMIAAAAMLLALQGAAHAYVGPGAGLTLVGSAIGLALALFAALGAVLSWPIRRLLKRRREAAAAKAETVNPAESQAG